MKQICNKKKDYQQSSDKKLEISLIKGPVESSQLLNPFGSHMKISPKL